MVLLLLLLSLSPIVRSYLSPEKPIALADKTGIYRGGLTAAAGPVWAKKKNSLATLMRVCENEKRIRNCTIAFSLSPRGERTTNYRVEKDFCYMYYISGSFLRCVI